MVACGDRRRHDRRNNPPRSDDVAEAACVEADEAEDEAEENRREQLVSDRSRRLPRERPTVTRRNSSLRSSAARIASSNTYAPIQSLIYTITKDAGILEQFPGSPRTIARRIDEFHRI